MRSELVMCASKCIPSRYLLTHPVAKATRAFHRPNTRIAETTNDVLRQFSTKNAANVLSGRFPIVLLVLCVAAGAGSMPCASQSRSPEEFRVILTAPPEAHSPVVLTAVNDPISGKGSFQFQGRNTPPVIHARPGTTLHVTYINSMTIHSHELCADGPCMNMTNLHFHGLHVSPDAPQDDVISMMATPGETLDYSVVIPEDQPPGLYWYHTHPHGESYQQDLDGMSGAIVVDGIERYAPEVRYMRQRILILRDRVTSEHDPHAPMWRGVVEVSQNCSPKTEASERIFTVNGAVRPQIPIAAQEQQFWRIVNASPDLYADLEVDGEQLKMIALDGMPLGFHEPKRKAELVDHILVPPAGRVEVIVTGPRDGRAASLRTRCFDTGPDGDPNPAMVVADLIPGKPYADHPGTNERLSGAAFYKPVPYKILRDVESRVPDFTVKFTEDKHGFYINDRKYGPTDPPMTTAAIGSYYHWHVVNSTREVHPFHIHQVHFLVYARNGQPLKQPEWLDTVNVPVGENLDMVMDFTDPIIRGVSLFHCHLLNHEDKGMMAKVAFK